MSRVLTVRRLGVVPYDEATALQERLVADRAADRIGDTLLLLQHPHVITLGVRVRDDWSHILASRADLDAHGVQVRQSGRGGDVTYHGPGQLVGYPILDLKPDRQDLHRYVRDLEEALIRGLSSFGVTGSRVSGLTGVWVGDAKIAAIGVRIARWITSHGFALNVTADLDFFRLIVPCGITDRDVTSLDRLLGRRADINAVADAVVTGFGKTFGYDEIHERSRE